KVVSLNQIVDKIASSKSNATNVKVTSSTPHLDLSKNTVNTCESSTDVKKVGEDEDEKVSTSSDARKDATADTSLSESKTESSVKSTSGNLVIRISTKTGTCIEDKTQTSTDAKSQNGKPPVEKEVDL